MRKNFIMVVSVLLLPRERTRDMTWERSALVRTSIIHFVSYIGDLPDNARDASGQVLWNFDKERLVVFNLVNAAVVLLKKPTEAIFHLVAGE